MESFKLEKTLKITSSNHPPGAIKAKPVYCTTSQSITLSSIYLQGWGSLFQYLFFHFKNHPNIQLNPSLVHPAAISSHLIQPSHFQPLQTLSPTASPSCTQNVRTRLIWIPT